MATAESQGAAAAEPRRVGPELAWLGGGYFVLALVSIELALQPQVIADVWFPNALAIGVLATAPRKRWGLMLLAVALANFAANVVLRGAPLLSASFVPGNLAEIAFGAWLLARSGLARRFADDGVAFIAAIAAGGLAPQILGATIGAAVLHAYGFASFNVAWPVWYVDSTLGAMAVLPLTLSIRQWHGPAAWRQLLKPLPLLFAGLTAATVVFAFRVMPYPFAFVSLPLVAGVFLFAPVVTFSLAFVLVLTVLVGFDFGWFQRPPHTAPWSNIFLYLPAAATVLPAQLLTVVVQRMRRMQADTAALTMIGTDVAALFDARGVFRSVNLSYSRYFGRDATTVIGRRIEEVVTPNNAALVRERFEHVMKSGQPLRAQSEIETALGRRILDVEYLPVLHAQDGGPPGGVLFSSHDVTELVSMQRELESNVSHLRAANDGMQQFVRIASHDMREPLNTIVQFCGLIETAPQADLSTANREYFRHIRTGALRMRALLDDVLSLVRLDQSDAMPLRAVALKGVLAAVTDALAARISQRSAHITLGELHAVQGHESLLVLLFQNLISNSIKFTPPERAPEVRVVSRIEGPWVIVTVSDRGIGIPLADQASLFVPFKRLHTRRQYDGTGLGLAICKRVVELMKGEITLESHPNVGTSVHVRLPAADAGAAPSYDKPQAHT